MAHFGGEICEAAQAIGGWLQLSVQVVAVQDCERPDVVLREADRRQRKDGSDETLHGLRIIISDVREKPVNTGFR